MLYIAIDGVPPRSKIEQQRARRFGNTRSDTSEGAIDTNMITPGTPFMYALCNAITRHIETQPLYARLHVIFSSANVPMEGEHKIFNYIRQHHDALAECQLVIYGLDADLIMLSIASHMPNIYLLREKTEYGTYSDTLIFEGHEFLYLDVDLVKECIIREFEHHIGDIEPRTAYRTLDDYVFLCFLLGNDFIAKIPWLTIKNGGHDILLAAYAQMYNMHYIYLFEGQYAKTNTLAFYYLIEILNSMEDAEMRELHRKRVYARPNMSRVSNEIERRQQLEQQAPLLHLNVEFSIGYQYPRWQDRYMLVCFHQKATTCNIDNIVMQYLESLVWTARYYYQYPDVGVPSWSWFYPHHYAPSVRDIFAFQQMMEKTHSLNGIERTQEPWKYSHLNNNMNNIAFKKHKPVKHAELLLMVLPPSSHSAAGIAEYAKSPRLSRYFPETYSISYPFHTFTWECHPIMPIIDYADIKKCISDKIAQPSDKIVEKRPAPQPQ
jgi:5'-3' exoribonuclease 1